MENYRAELEKRISEVLYYIWDPIGVCDGEALPEVRDEYDSYVYALTKAAMDGKSQSEIAKLLTRIVTDRIELPPREEHDNKVAGLILDWSRYIKEKQTDENQIGESGLRILLDKSGERPFNPIATLDEARLAEGAYLIFEGDHGGQIYLTVPVGHINCDQAALQKLLREVDSLAWNDPSGATMYFEAAKPGQGVPGGMDGGYFGQKLWVHDELDHLYSPILNYLAGRSNTIHSQEKVSEHD